MAEFHLFIAVSLDGFIATPSGGVEWLNPFEAEDYGYDAFLQDMDSLVMGRFTYEQIRAGRVWPYLGKPCLILTSTALNPPVPELVEPWFGGTRDLIAGLRRMPGRVWVVGGARTIHAFLMAGAVDRLAVFTMPLMLGNGIRLFPPGPPPRRLRLLECRSWDNGSVLCRYGIQEEPVTPPV